MAILVTGGAGYIGSVTVVLLRQAGEQVVVLDNLSKGHRAAVSASVPLYEGDVGDTALVTRICREHEIEACIHFAAFTDVGESVKKPHEYYSNNVAQAFTLLAALQAAAVRYIVFSSTCATYGEPLHLPIDETHPQSPCNPYGWSKFMLERVLIDYERAFGLRFVALRYFNAAGALPEYGEDHRPETHLIPIVLQTALGQRSQVTVFGNDYDTPDGTAMRDYIHIADLGQAHLKALRHLRDGGSSEAINLGNGNGYSVLEVIETARQISSREIPVVIAPRRAGDAVRLIADAAKATAVLGWQPRFPELQTIIETAWAWHSARPNGYEK
jgi:UDP-glucose 4-epimerase